MRKPSNRIAETRFMTLVYAVFSTIAVTVMLTMYGLAIAGFFQ